MPTDPVGLEEIRIAVTDEIPEVPVYEGIIGVDSGCDSCHPIRLFVTSIGDYLGEIEANIKARGNMKITEISLIKNSDRFAGGFHGLLYEISREVEKRRGLGLTMHLSLGKGDKRVYSVGDQKIKPEEQIEILREIYNSTIGRLETLTH